MLLTTSSKLIVSVFAFLSILFPYQVSAADNLWRPKDPNEPPFGTDLNSHPTKWRIEDLTEEVSHLTLSKPESYILTSAKQFLAENMNCHIPDEKTILTNCMFYTKDMTDPALNLVLDDYRVPYDYKHTIWVCPNVPLLVPGNRTKMQTRIHGLICSIRRQNETGTLSVTS